MFIGLILEDLVDPDDPGDADGDADGEGAFSTVVFDTEVIRTLAMETPPSSATALTTLVAVFIALILVVTRALSAVPEFCPDTSYLISIPDDDDADSLMLVILTDSLSMFKYVAIDASIRFFFSKLSICSLLTPSNVRDCFSTPFNVAAHNTSLKLPSVPHVATPPPVNFSLHVTSNVEPVVPAIAFAVDLSEFST